MTLIEIFDRFAPENITACLYLRPEKLILVGDGELLEPFLPRCQAFLWAHGVTTRVTNRPVPMQNIERSVAEVAQILREEKECAIEIAGGDERILMALGVALAGLDRRAREKVKVLRFDPKTQTMQTLDGTTVPATGPAPRLQMEELVKLQGGVLHPTTEQPALAYTAADLDDLWALACRDHRRWNRCISALATLESRANFEERICLNLRAIRGSIGDFDNNLARARSLLADLNGCGAIRDRSWGDYLEYSYTSPLLRWCTLKAGNLLETKTLLEARALRDGSKPYFHECRMGVHMDWDGKVYDTPKIPETRNEVDVVLMRGITPLFVSCKNGDIGETELYKLNTVATRFGGPNVRKMLIATEHATGGLRQRAEDMGILLMADAGSRTKQGWQDIFLQAMQPGSTAANFER